MIIDANGPRVWLNVHNADLTTSRRCEVVVIRGDREERQFASRFSCLRSATLCSVTLPRPFKPTLGSKLGHTAGLGSKSRTRLKYQAKAKLCVPAAGAMMLGRLCACRRSA